ncbi:MAG: uracil-DNA glycosylase family protein [Candidatus Dormibacteria bacterium]
MPRRGRVGTTGATPGPPPLEAHARAHRACTRCCAAGLLPRAHPVFSLVAGARVLLVGQAPGPVEDDVTRPFAGRAGHQLMRWFERAGLGDEARVRRRIAFTSMTTCFPGRNRAGTGDRRPSGTEVRLCSTWLDGDLSLLKPPLVLAVGGLAHSRFMPGRRLDELVGRVFDGDGGAVAEPWPGAGRLVLPLPHPSGQSRWLNDPTRVNLLNNALERLTSLVEWAEACPE